MKAAGPKAVDDVQRQAMHPPLADEVHVPRNGQALPETRLRFADELLFAPLQSEQRLRHRRHEVVL